jgi:non-ribosomal peptide synthetase component F
MSASAQADSFARDNLPPRAEWPELIFTLPELRYPERLNAAVELLDRMVARGCRDRPCLVWPEGSWTYGELLAHANRIAAFLVKDLGLVPGNRVLLRGYNGPWLAASWFAVLKAGGIAVTTMPLLRAFELNKILDKAQVRLALCDARLGAELEAAAERTPVLERIVYWGEAASGEGLEGLIAARAAEFESCPTAAEDVALIAFTSGTTGQPKGTVHFHRDILAICDCFPPHILKARPDDLFSGSPPLGFTFGLGGLLTFPLRIGAATLLLEKAPPETLLDAIPRHRVSVLFTAPTAYRAMAAQAEGDALGSLRRCVSAGEPLPDRLPLPRRSAAARLCPAGLEHHRRHLCPRRRRLFLLPRAQRRHDHLGRLQHRRPRGRGGAARPRGGGRVRGRGGARRRARHDRQGVRRPQARHPGRRGDGPGAAGACQGTDRALQISPCDRVPRCAAEDRDRQAAALPAA